MTPSLDTFPVLHTPRLNLIELSQHHAPDLFQLFTDTRVTEFYTVIPLKKESDIKKIITMLARRFKDRSGIRWGIVRNDQPGIIGTIGFNYFYPGHKGSIAYALRFEHWNNGYITEAIAALLRFGFNTLELTRIEAEVMPGNTGSEKVLDKNGFRNEGLLRQWLLWEGKQFDINMYALLKEDYTIEEV